MGESTLKRIRPEETLLSCAGVQTPSGEIQVRWESSIAGVSGFLCVRRFAELIV